MGTVFPKVIQPAKPHTEPRCPEPQEDWVIMITVQLFQGFIDKGHDDTLLKDTVKSKNPPRLNNGKKINLIISVQHYFNLAHLWFYASIYSQ